MPRKGNGIVQNVPGKGFRVRFSLPTKTGGYKDYYGQVHTDAGEADRDLVRLRQQPDKKAKLALLELLQAELGARRGGRKRKRGEDEEDAEMSDDALRKALAEEVAP